VAALTLQSRRFLSAYAAAAIAAAVLERALRGSVITACVKYAVMLSLFIYVLNAYKNKKTGFLLAAAFGCMAAGDFFLVLLSGLHLHFIGKECLGAFFFAIAYGCIILNYKLQQVTLRKTGAAAALLIVLSAFFVANVATAATPPDIPRLLGFLVFWAVISWMVLLSYAQMQPACARSKALFLSAVLMVICDACVAFNYLHPGMPVINPLLKDLTWLAYIPGWALLAVTVVRRHTAPRQVRSPPS
jgi:hypothetical protein